MDDHELLRTFARSRSQEAFRQLVDRHLRLVYAAAHRIVRDPHLAEEVAQNVFTLLAQKAGEIVPSQVVAGWLYHSTRHLSGPLFTDPELNGKLELWHIAFIREKKPRELPNGTWERAYALVDGTVTNVVQDSPRLPRLLRLRGRTQPPPIVLFLTRFAPPWNPRPGALWFRPTCRLQAAKQSSRHFTRCPGFGSRRGASKNVLGQAFSPVLPVGMSSAMKRVIRGSVGPADWPARHTVGLAAPALRFSGSSNANPIPETRRMTACAACGNAYDRPIEVKLDGQTFAFDSFECAIHLLAPVCPHCNCRIIGHGVQVADKVYCCAHCARLSGSPAINDRT